MSENISQELADHLMRLAKRRTKFELVNWPRLGEKASVDLISLDEKEAFLLDIERGYIKLSKLTLQNRARAVVPLVRLDIDGPSHRNPDDTEVPCPHLHLYREGYATKWAYPVPTLIFTNLEDRRQILADFMKFCHIVDPPEFHGDLLA
jgi:hypothetical protein